jgi:hypothetical protein
LQQNNGKKKKTKPMGTVSYNDPASSIFFDSSKITGLSFNGNQAHLTGIASHTKKKTVTFTIDATDNGTPGTLDTFSIQLSTGYSASGNLTSGDITIQ